MYGAGRWLAPLLALTLTAQTAPQQGDVERILAVQNEARRSLGIAPLAWNPDLAAEAQRWADQLALTGSMAHTDGSARSGNGENLWAGTKGRYSPDQMVAAWIEEKRNFKSGRFPDNSRTGDWEAVAHYTQIVWRGSREVGCAIATGRAMDFLVCRYREPGNVIGQTPY